MGLLKKRKKAKHLKKAHKDYKKSSQGEKAYCTTCYKWYDPSNRRQFRKHSH